MGYERNDYGRGAYGRRPGYGERSDFGPDRHSGYVNYSTGNRFRSNRDDDRWGGGDYDDDRGFLERAGDELRSWFGDEDAQRRRERDLGDEGRTRGDDRFRARDAGLRHDPGYQDWRRRQIEALDRDYDDYRRENQTRFDSEFGTWRTGRHSQRTALERVEPHMDVVGSDGQHVGTVDKIRGDRIILTKNDPDAGGHHHSIPSRWISAVEDKVTITKTADEAKAAWRDEERSGALFGNAEDSRGPHVLNRAFSGTY